MGVNVTNIPKNVLLAELFNAAKPFGMGMLHYNANHIMSYDEAQKLLDDTNHRHDDLGSNDQYFDYLEGRGMKIDLSDKALEREATYKGEKILEERMYDRYYYSGKVQDIVDKIRSEHPEYSLPETLKDGETIG